MNIIKILFKTILIALIVAILTPIAYFAWRMNQPLRYRDFNGLTYYQYTDWLSMEYEINIDSGKYKTGSCRFNEGFMRIGDLTLLPTQTFFYTTGGLLGVKADPAHGIIALPDDYYSYANYSSINPWSSFVNIDVTLWDFLPKWWNAYEFLVWFNSGPRSQAKNLCPIHSPVPTPQEFETMKQARQQANVMK